MSTSAVYARPLSRAVGVDPHPRHIEIVATRMQRRARPRIAYAIVTVSSVFAIFATQLLLSIVVSQGAYEIQGLQAEQKELLRTQQHLNETLDLLGSPQNLSASAANLGMVPGASPLFLDLNNGAVSGAPSHIDRKGCGGSCNLVANALLDGSALLKPQTQNPKTDHGPASREPASREPASGEPGASETIPAPVTH
jgi:hypothetical protein